MKSWVMRTGKLGFLFFFLIFLLNTIMLSAQEETPVVEPTIEMTEIIIPTNAPATIPTIEESNSDAIPSPEWTESPVISNPSEPTTTFPPEPPFTLLVREFFDNGDLSPWTPSPSWSIAPDENGQALSVHQSSQAIEWQKGSFYNLAVQASFLFDAGAAQISLRNTVNGQYTIRLNAHGLLELYRGETLVQSNEVTANQTGQWRILRVSAVEGMLRISVDNLEILSYLDTSPLSMGTVSILADFGQNQGNLLVDDFFIWVPESELGNYPAPTPFSVPIVNPTDVIAPTTIPVSRNSATGPKDLSAFPPPSLEQLASANAGLSSTLGNNDFIGIDILSLPSLSIDHTTGDTLEVNESLPTCGFGLSNTVWFSLTPSVNANYSFSSVGSDFDTILAIYTGSSVDDLTLVVCNDDVSATNLTSAFSVNLSAGITYRIQLGGFNGRYGNYRLLIQQSGLAIPTAPSLFNPVNGFRTNDTSLSLSWNPVLNASQYEIQVATNATFTAGLQSHLVTAPTTSFEIPTLSNTAGTIYYWRVRARNINSQAGAFSAYRVFTLDTTAPNIPSLSLPANGSVTSNSRPVLSWLAVATATSYLIDIDDNSDFSSPEVNDEVSNLTSFTAPDSLAQGQYYWRVQARDDVLNVGLESSSRSFTINILTAPANNAVLFTGTGSFSPILTWATVTGASGYTLQLDDDNDFSDASMIDEDLGLLTTHIPTLNPGIYYWQIIPTGVEQTVAVYRQFTISPVALIAPVLANPVNASRTNDASPTLSWSDVPDAAQYEVQVATNATFTTGLQSHLVAASNNNLELPTLSNTAGTLYYWRVRTLNNFGVAGTFSPYRAFTLDTTAPNMPTLSLPANGTTTSNSRPVLSWLSVATATSYLVYIDDNSDFSSPEVNNEVSNLTSFTPPSSLPQGQYYWRVQARDNVLNVGMESISRSFIINILTAPANNAILFTGTGTFSPVLTWATVTGASGYTLQVDDDSDFSDASMIDEDLGLLTTYTPTLNPGNYYWQIIPTGVEQTAAVYRQFTVSPVALIAPVLANPVNGFRTNDARPALSWSDVPDAAQYEVQVATNATFTTGLQSHLVAASNNNLELPTLSNTAGTLYYWRVRTLNNLGVAGAFSPYRTFTLDTTAPNIPTLSLPANGVISSNSRPVLSWLAVATATSYLVDIDNDSDFSSPEANNEVSNLASFTPPDSLPQGQYYWRVQARDNVLNVGMESASRSFTINILMAPANNAVLLTGNGSFSPTLRWAAVTGASGYTLQLDDDSDFSDASMIDEDLGLVTSYTIFPPLSVGIYYWQVIPTDVEQTAAVYRRFTISSAVLAAPILANPVNAFKTNDTSPTLSWNTVLNASQYEVQVATNATFTAGLQSHLVTAPTASFELPTLSNTAGTLYYWRVRTLNNFEVAGAFSPYRAFTLDTVIPTIPNLLAPANNTATSNNRPVFQWGAVAGAVRYEIRYGISIVLDTTVSVAALSYVPPSPLLTRDYSWQVRAIDGAGNVSDWSVLRVVKINSLPTATPVLNRFTSSTPTLSWSPVTWTSPSGYYQLQVDNNITFASPEYLSGNIPTGTQSHTTSPLANGTWYWRIRACTGVNVCGAWSAVGVFAVEE